LVKKHTNPAMAALSGKDASYLLLPPDLSTVFVDAFHKFATFI